MKYSKKARQTEGRPPAKRRLSARRRPIRISRARRRKQARPARSLPRLFPLRPIPLKTTTLTLSTRYPGRMSRPRPTVSKRLRRTHSRTARMTAKRKGGRPCGRRSVDRFGQAPPASLNYPRSDASVRRLSHCVRPRLDGFGGPLPIASPPRHRAFGEGRHRRHQNSSSAS